MRGSPHSAHASAASREVPRAEDRRAIGGTEGKLDVADRQLGVIDGTSTMPILGCRVRAEEGYVNIAELFGRSCREFDRRVAKMGSDQLALGTPCTEWDVRALVNHVVVEDLWVPPLLQGATIEEVGDRFDGDQLGDDAQGAWRAAQEAAVQAVESLPSVESTVHLSSGDYPASFYLGQLIFDHTVHAWDLASAIGADTRLDPELVNFSIEEFAAQENHYRASGAIGERPDIPAGADPQTRLLAMFGRRPT